MNHQYGEPFEVDGIWYDPNTAGDEQHQGFGQIKEDGCTAGGIANHFFCMGGDSAQWSAALGKYV